MIAIPVFGTWQIVRSIQQITIRGLIDSDIATFEIVAIALVLLLIAWTVLVIDGVISVKKGFVVNLGGVLHRPIALIAGALVVTPQLHVAPPTVQTTQSVPVTAAVSPVIAASVVRYILRRRRQQTHDWYVPARLTSDELQALSAVVHRAGTTHPSDQCEIDLITDIDVVQILHAVERPHVIAEVTDPDVVTEWAAVVRVFGYPEVMSVNGEKATFRKKRSLELVTWLTLNRDRSRRSAARTALWEFDVSDATFSTVVSDMRRGLAELEPQMSREEWAPPTFTDEIPLSNRVVTDAELLAAALRRFQSHQDNINELLLYLSWIRDVPFAGTAYSWADLDGSTTRLVILALTAAREVADWAVATGHQQAREIAVTAGLRVMPGDQELLAVLTY